MNHKERIFAVMNLEKPDRIPFMCQLSIGHFLQQLNISPAEFWLDKNVYTQALIDMRNIYDFDGILVSLYGHSSEWKQSVKSIKNENDAEIVEWNNGSKTIFPFNDLPLHVTSEPNFFNFDFSYNNILPDVIDYIPVSQGLHFSINHNEQFGVINDIVNRVGNKYSIHGEVTSPFDYYLDLTGHMHGLMGLVDFPEKVHSILKHFTFLIKNLASSMCETGIDAIKISSPFAGSGFISPNDYREFVLPYEKVIAQVIKEKKKYVYTHTCGAINDRLEMMFDSGINGIECLDPQPIGDVDLLNAKIRTKHFGFIKGNLDSVNLLLFGNDFEIISETKKCLHIGKKYGGLILSTACSVAPSVKKEKLLLVRETVEKYG